MPEHRCGPTSEQVNRALQRGEVIGTWERCDECTEREEILWARLGEVVRHPTHTRYEVREITPWVPS